MRPPASAMEPVEFFTQVRPILAAHCYKCHGPEKRSGGLRLDQMEFAKTGGDSGNPILGGTLETNELYRRVASDERTYRMPKNAPALPPEEIETIKRWVEQGAAWPMQIKFEKEELPFYGAFSQLNKLLSRYRYEYDYLVPFAIAFVVSQLALLVVIRVRRAYLQNRPWTTRRAVAVCRFCGRITTRELGLAWFCLIALGGVAVLRAHQLRIEAELEVLSAARMRSDSPWARTVFGFPPVPIHPDHPKRLGGTYYRGNCERNPELFNNGNYLTAIFRISLHDSQNEPVVVGDSLPVDGLSIRVELERAEGTSDLLYTPEFMKSVFLTETFFSGEKHNSERPLVRLEILKESKLWAANVPIGPPGDTGKLSGLIYVYVGQIGEGERVESADPHYAVKYDLEFKDGKLTEESELWMNAFGNGAFSDPQPPSKLPFTEWFDYRPIPTISGKNSTDPKLLGVDEYVRKGLIKPPTDEKNTAEPPADEPDATDQKDE